MRRAYSLDSSGPRRDVVSAWLYVRLGECGEIQAVQGEGLEDPSLIAALAYAKTEPLPGRFGGSYGWIQNEGTSAIVAAKQQGGGLSRVVLVLRQPVRRRPMLKALVDEADTLLQRCDGQTPEGNRDALAARSTPIIGMVHVSTDLLPTSWWYTSDASLGRIVDVVSVRDNALQTHVLALTRALTHDWGENNGASRAARAGTLLPGLIMHVFPASIEGAFAVLVFEHVRLRRSLRDAFTDFSITSREAQVIRLLMSGHSVREAADVLSIAESTTHDHIKSVLTKTHARNRAQMISTLLGYEGVAVRPPAPQP